MKTKNGTRQMSSMRLIKWKRIRVRESAMGHQKIIIEILLLCRFGFSNVKIKFLSSRIRVKDLRL